MKKIFLAMLTLAASLTTSAQDNPLWMRFCAISPDGQTIAFSYKGDIYTVAAAGGTARQLTTNAAYDAYPVWSPDGQKIAFASTREGGFDVFLMSSQGGVVHGTVVSIGDDTVKMDFNHALAGKELHFSGKVTGVRDATEKELTDGLHGERAAQDCTHDCSSCGGGCGN